LINEIYLLLLAAVAEDYNPVWYFDFLPHSLTPLTRTTLDPQTHSMLLCLMEQHIKFCAAIACYIVDEPLEMLMHANCVAVSTPTD